MPVPAFLQIPLSLKTIASQLWDLNAIPRPRTFEILSLNCQNELEKERLIEFIKPGNQEELFSYANRPRRTILEVLTDFPHSTSQLTLQLLFELFQFIKPRSFSIASCHESNQLDLLVAVVEYKTFIQKRRIGLCSNWLKSLENGRKVKAIIKKGCFKFPTDENVPVVMVGPGTGLAPFRSFLMANKINRKERQIKECVYILYFGCRGREKDFHCR